MKKKESRDLSSEAIRKLGVYCQFHEGMDMCPDQSFNVNEKVFEIGEKPKGLFFIKKGFVKITSASNNGEPLLIRTARPGELIGFVSLIKRWDYTSTAIVLEEATIQFIPKKVFFDLLQTDNDFINIMLQILCEQTRYDEQQIVNLLSKNAKQRLAALLLSLEMVKEECNTNLNHLHHLPRKDIAGNIGVTPETVSRYIAEFKLKGFISESKNGIEIINRNALLRLSKVND